MSESFDSNSGQTGDALEQLGQLPTEARNPRSERIDQLSTIEMLALINEEDASVSRAVRAALPQIASVVEEVARRYVRGARVFYVGAGTSGRLGVLDASECPPTFSVPPERFIGIIAGGDGALRRSSELSEDSPETGASDVEKHRPTRDDVVIGIAASGRTPYVLGALARARQAGAFTVALTCAGGAGQPSRMARLAEQAIELATGPEVITGSTRMKAGTATKMVLNMISTGVMIRCGAVYGNLMVNLQPSNAKLKDRAERIIASACGISAPEAAEMLQAGGSVKAAIVMQKLGVSRAAADKRLAEHGGLLSATLGRSQDDPKGP